VLERAMRRLHQESRQTIGYRGMVAGLAAEGIVLGTYRVRKLMRRLGMPKRRRRSEHYKRATKPAIVAPNRLNRNFDPAQPNLFWAGDITQIRIGASWLHLAIVVDLFSRRIVGWGFGRIADAHLSEAALRMALQARRPPVGVMFHSDQGAQYTAERFVSFLTKHGAVQSMSRRGNCWDNAVVERVFRTLKHEWIPVPGYRSHEEARRDITDFIVNYNLYRRHSRLNHVSPAHFEQLASLSS
jgi:putative transposase